MEKVALANFPALLGWLVTSYHAVIGSPELNKVIEGEDDFAFSDSKGPVFQPRPIRIQTIRTLRSKPAIAYMGPYSNGYTRKMIGPERVIPSTQRFFPIYSY